MCKRGWGTDGRAPARRRGHADPPPPHTYIHNTQTRYIILNPTKKTVNKSNKTGASGRLGGRGLQRRRRAGACVLPSKAPEPHMCIYVHIYTCIFIFNIYKHLGMRIPNVAGVQVRASCMHACVGVHPRRVAHTHHQPVPSKGPRPPTRLPPNPPQKPYHPPQDLAAGDVHVLKYRVVRPLLLSEDVELI